MKRVFKILSALFIALAIPFGAVAQENPAATENVSMEGPEVNDVLEEKVIDVKAASSVTTTLKDSAFDMKNAFGVFFMLTYNSYYAGLEYERWFDRHGMSIGGFVISFDCDIIYDWLLQYRYSIVQDEYNANYAHRVYTYAKFGNFGDGASDIGVNVGAGLGYEMLIGKRLMYTPSFGVTLGWFDNIFTIMPDFGSSLKFRW